MLKTIVLHLTLLGLYLPVPLHHFNFSDYTSDVSEERDCTSDKSIKESILEENKYRIKKIVIDPGHGGKDGGCSGKHSHEKTLVLQISKKLEKLFRQYHPEVEVILTRTTDKFIPLHERAAIANRNKADLFMSIHCNYISNASKVKGSETYVMGLHTADHNLEVAKRENASILLEDDYEKHYDGFDPNSPEGHIIISMFQHAFLEQSISFAEKVEANIVDHAHGKSRGVRQAGFVVLKETAMPSVLIEAGYLSNGHDEAYLSTDKGQNEMARAILNAFRSYKAEMEGNSVVPVPPQPVALSVVTPATTAKMIPVKHMQRPKKEDMVVQYKVQLAASRTPLDLSISIWKNAPYQIEVKKEGSYYKYLARGFEYFQKAEEGKNRLRRSGFDGAFVVSYLNGVRVPLEEARRFEKKSDPKAFPF